MPLINIFLSMLKNFIINAFNASDFRDAFYLFLRINEDVAIKVILRFVNFLLFLDILFIMLIWLKFIMYAQLVFYLLSFFLLYKKVDECNLG